MKPIVLSILLLLAPFTHADVLRIASYAWEPFIDAKRDDGGISISVVRKIFEDQGHTVELVNASWSDSLTLFNNNEIDILPAVWYKKKRGETMLYSTPYAKNRLVFIKPKGSQYEFDGLSSLHGKTVGTVKGYAYSEGFMRDQKIQRSEKDSLQTNVNGVIAGEIDLTIDDEIAAKASIGANQLAKIDFTKNALSEVPLFITCKKQSPKCDDLIEEFNVGLKIMKKNGSLQALLDSQ